MLILFDPGMFPLVRAHGLLKHHCLYMGTEMLSKLVLFDPSLSPLVRAHGLLNIPLINSTSRMDLLCCEGSQRMGVALMLCGALCQIGTPPHTKFGKLTEPSNSRGWRQALIGWNQGLPLWAGRMAPGPDRLESRPGTMGWEDDARP